MKQYYSKFLEWRKMGRVYQTLQLDQVEKHTCLNCGQEYTGKFCPNCGQRSNVRRLSLMGVLNDFMQLANDLDFRLLRTIIELCLRPGYMVRNYIIDCKRRRYTAPITLIFILETIEMLLKHIISGTDMTRHLMSGDVHARFLEFSKAYGDLLYKGYLVVDWIFQNPALTAVICMTIYVLPNKFSFRKTELGRTMNYLEHFYLIIYISCLGAIFRILSIPIDYLTMGTAMNNSQSSVITFLVYWWVVTEFFQISKRRGMKLTLLVYISMAVAIFILAILAVCVISFISMRGEVIREALGN